MDSIPKPTPRHGQDLRLTHLYPWPQQRGQVQNGMQPRMNRWQEAPESHYREARRAVPNTRTLQALLEEEVAELEVEGRTVEEVSKLQWYIFSD